MTQIGSRLVSGALQGYMVRGAAVLIAVVLATSPATAQLFGGSRDDGETVLRLNQVEDQMRTLTGQVEELSFQIRQLQEQIRRMQEDNEYRLQQLEQGGGGTGKRSDAGGAAAPATADPGRDSYGPAAGPSTLGQLRLGSDGGAASPDAGTGAGSGDEAFAREGGYDETPGLGAGPLDLSALARGQGGAGPAAPGPGFDPAVPGSGGSGLPSATDAPAAGPRLDAGVGAVPRDAYDSAYSRMIAGDYAGAEEGFRQFLETRPNDPLAANAQFWLGETYFARKQYREAADAFLKSYTDYPDSSKVTDSLLKLGLSLKGIGQTAAACATFSELLTKYPGAPTTIRAEAQAQKQASGCAA